MEFEYFVRSVDFTRIYVSLLKIFMRKMTCNSKSLAFPCQVGAKHVLSIVPKAA